MGIYAIVCNKTWRAYVGQSVDIWERKTSHLQLLKRSIHENKGLQEDFDRFGEESLSWEVLEECDDHLRLGELERKWIGLGCNLYNKTNVSSPILLNDNQTVLFWMNIKVLGEDDCWLWKDTCRDKDGYGRVSYRMNGQKKVFRANRVAYYLTYPNDPIDLQVCHKCDNPPCCNPNHLFLSSGHGNKIDCRDKERLGKLSWEQVKIIREKFCENSNIHHNDLYNWCLENLQTDICSSYLITLCQNRSWFDKEYIPPSRIDGRIENATKNSRNVSKLNWDLINIAREKFIKEPNIHSEDLRDWFFKETNIKLNKNTLLEVCLNRTWYNPEYVVPNRIRKQVRKNNIEV